MKAGARVLPVFLALAGLVVILLAVGVPPLRPMRVIEPDAAARHFERYFGFAGSNAVPRTIGRVRGAFTVESMLEPALFTVRNGQAECRMSLLAGRSSCEIPSPHWAPMEITLALGEERTAGATLTSLGCAGMRRAGGSPQAVTNFARGAHASLLTGPLFRGREYIVYVEGDRPFAAERRSSAAEFAKSNPAGNFLVVSLYVH